VIRVDSGARAFWMMLGASIVTRLFIAYGTCCLIMAVTGAVHDGGLAVLSVGRYSVLPALLLLALVATGTARGFCSLGLSLWRTLRFIRTVRRNRTGHPPRLSAVADRLGLGGRLVTADFDTPFALTYGIVRPRVLLSTGLVAALTDPELAAVLVHERQHLTSRDPLKNVLASAIPARLFYLPVLTRLHARFICGSELAADRAALTACGIAPLAGALLKVTDGPGWATTAPMAAMGSNALLDIRITQLETGREPAPSPIGRRITVRTVLGAALVLGAVLWSADLVAHYMPACLPRGG
jgi:Zn-dependent protease with chaperone function